MKNILIYCGSSAGHNEVYKKTATQVGETLAKQGLSLIYGGGSVGLMGTVADAILAKWGRSHRGNSVFYGTLGGSTQRVN